MVANQETEIHPTSDLSPFAENRIWDERDIPALRLMTEAVHEQGCWPRSNWFTMAITRKT